MMYKNFTCLIGMKLKIFNQITYHKTKKQQQPRIKPNTIAKCQQNKYQINETCRCRPETKKNSVMITLFFHAFKMEQLDAGSLMWPISHALSYKNRPTGVTLIIPTEKDTTIMEKVNISREYFRFLKKELNSSIRPVITHSRPPI